MGVLVLVTSLLALGEAARGSPQGAEPVQLFAFDLDPGCSSTDCLPADGAFYPGRARRQGKSFSGTPLQIPEGTDIEFTNLSSEHHNIVSFATRRGRPLFASDEHVLQGSSSSIRTRYLEPGTYAYFCGHHPTTMFGVIEIVEDSAS
ncbi:MAG: plastocyanin/azurin family copper-binding protein [Actinomycetota bacterium]|nr:plastocyanin/azurin family copper-binding protein [Actinomycetota bacterium]